MANYPDSLPNLTDPLASNKMNAPSHSGLHTSENEEIDAIAAELGLVPSGGSATVVLRLDGIDTAVGLNTAKTSYTDAAAVGLNTTHRTSNGTDHGYIDQDVTSGSSPVLNASNMTNIPSTGARGTFTNATLSSGVLTITHSLGLSTPFILNTTIVDDSQKMIIPDEITFANNTIVVDLSSYGTLTGTWGYYYA
jgi:hypothetical protein